MNPLRFHERMSGWISFDEHSYNQAAGHGKRAGNACAQSLEIEIADLDRFIDDPAHVAAAEGVVECPSLGGTLHVQPGSTFNLFAGFQGRRHKRMLYRLYLRDREERTLTLSGFKDLENDPNLDVWGDTSRLFVRILSGHVEHDPLGHELTVATGILYISRLELMKRSPARAARRGPRPASAPSSVAGCSASTQAAPPPRGARTSPPRPTSTPAGRITRRNGGTTSRITPACPGGSSPCARTTPTVRP